MKSTPEFFNVQPVQDALATLFSLWEPQIKTETLDPRNALGRVLTASSKSPSMCILSKWCAPSSEACYTQPTLRPAEPVANPFDERARCLFQPQPNTGDRRSVQSIAADRPVHAPARS